MAQFTNQAQLSYNGGLVNSNIAVGEILEVLSATKTSLQDNYNANDRVGYVISATNSGTTPITGVTVTDNLGTYAFGQGFVVPQNYVPSSVRAYINGESVTAPTATTGADGSVTFSGITIPAGANLILVYETQINSFAPLGPDASITNTALVSGNGITTPVATSVTLNANSEPSLAISKTIEPIPVAENGILTYRFTIQNYGAAAADAADNIVLTDTFAPILSSLTVTLDGAALAEGTGYTYNEATGLFSTTQGAITVPAATYSQDAATGRWIVTPGVATLVVSGTV